MKATLYPKLILLVMASSLLWGCASTLKQPAISEDGVQSERQKQTEMALLQFIAREERLNNIAFPLKVSSAEICGDQAERLHGYLLHDKATYTEEQREFAIRHFGLDDHVTVRYIHQLSPAGAAGLKVGDRLLSLNGQNLEKKNKDEVSKVLEQLSKEASTLTLKVERNGQINEISYSGVLGCKYPVVVVNNDMVNAFADGKVVMVTTGMIRFAETDAELALVLGHEIAHNALGHNSTARKASDIFLRILVGQLIAGLITNPFSKERESEADYEGLYISARGGYEISSAANFWRRMATEHPDSIKTNFLATHPSAPERFLKIEAAVKEIQEKKQRGAPLLPEKAETPAMETGQKPSESTAR